MGVPETEATTLSDPNKPEYLSPPLIRNKLNPKSIDKTKAIFDFPKLLNINNVASIIILSIREIFMIKINSFSSFFVANWKLNGDFKFIDQFIDNLEVPKDNSKCVVICPTSIHLDYMRRKKNNFFVGSQNVSEQLDGAFTGEISCNSLLDLNIQFCILGHSERRAYYNEDDELLLNKLKHSIECGMNVIFCFGEELSDRKSQNHFTVVKNQLDNTVMKVDKNSWKKIILAYEPVWAIGTGETASAEQAQEMH